MQEKHFVYFTFLDLLLSNLRKEFEGWSSMVQEYYAQKYHLHKLAKRYQIFAGFSEVSQSQAK